MDSFEKYLYWKNAAEYDIETAEVMLNSGRYLYVVFMCQQAIEKLVKGLFVLYLNEEPPKVHNIVFVFKKINWDNSIPGIEQEFEIYKPFLTELVGYYISGRYPDYKEKMACMINEVEAVRVLNKSKEVIAWLKSLKK